VPDERFAATCVLVDKLDKMPAAEVRGALVESGLPAESADTLLKALAVTDFGVLREVMGHDSPAVRELESLFDLAEAYGYNEWLVLDLSVVRGLAYYTGVVFEGFDRSGELRAIFGGGRYDKLLSTFGGEDVPAAGFGYGDAVIVELLKARGLLPTLPSSSVEVVVFAMGAELQPQAIGVAAALRAAGRKVDLLLEQKKAKWVFKHADRLQAGHVVVVAAAEAAQGLVRVKRLSDGQQEDVPIAELSDWFRRD